MIRIRYAFLVASRPGKIGTRKVVWKAVKVAKLRKAAEILLIVAVRFHVARKHVARSCKFSWKSRLRSSNVTRFLRVNWKRFLEFSRKLRNRSVCKRWNRIAETHRRDRVRIWRESSPVSRRSRWFQPTENAFKNVAHDYHELCT